MVRIPKSKYRSNRPTSKTVHFITFKAVQVWSPYCTCLIFLSSDDNHIMNRDVISAFSGGNSPKRKFYQKIWISENILENLKISLQCYVIGQFHGDFPDQQQKYNRNTQKTWITSNYQTLLHVSVSGADNDCLSAAVGTFLPSSIW